KVRGNAEDRAPFILEDGVRAAGRVDLIRVEGAGSTDAEVDAPVPRGRDPQGSDAVFRLAPTLGDDDLAVRPGVAIRVGDQRAFTFERDEHPIATAIARGEQVHANRGAEPAMIVPEGGDRFFQAVAVAV